VRKINHVFIVWLTQKGKIIVGITASKKSALLPSGGLHGNKRYSRQGFRRQDKRIDHKILTALNASRMTLNDNYL
jgi:hypothetical protein